jgi:two-component system secretion response regulator SsrB
VRSRRDSAEDGFRLIAETQAEACLFDLFMPGMPGVEAVREVRDRYPDLVIVVMTGLDEEELLEAAQEAGADAAMRKHRLLTDVGARLRAISVGMR